MWEEIYADVSMVEKIGREYESMVTSNNGLPKDGSYGEVTLGLQTQDICDG